MRMGVFGMRLWCLGEREEKVRWLEVVTYFLGMGS